MYGYKLALVLICYFTFLTWSNASSVNRFAQRFAQRLESLNPDPSTEVHNLLDIDASQSSSHEIGSQFSGTSADSSDVESSGVNSQTMQKQSGCQNNKACKTKETARLLRIEALKKHILEELGMEAPPNVTGRNLPKDSPPIRAMMRKHNLDRINEESLDEQEEIRTQQVISTPRPMPYNDGAHIIQNRIFFDFSEEERRDFQVKSASLWFFVRPVSINSTATLMVEEYKDTNDSFFTEIAPSFHTMRLMRLSSLSKKGHWKNIPLTGLVKKWFENPTLNHGMRLYTREISNLIPSGQKVGEMDLAPYLDVEIVTSRRSRKKRNALKNCDESENRCCLYSSTTSFESISFDWVIYPVAFPLDICRGECSILQLESMQSELVRQIELKNDSESVSSCCFPKKYGIMGMLYYDASNNIRYTEITDMKIKECGCA